MKTSATNRKRNRLVSHTLFFKKDLDKVKHPSIKRWIKSPHTEKEKGLRLITQSPITQPPKAGGIVLDKEAQKIVK